MRTSVKSIVTVLGIFCSASALMAGSYEQSFPLRPDGKLVVDHQAGDIRISAGTSDQLQIVSTDGTVPVTVSGDSLAAIRTKEITGSSREMDLTIIVPAGIQLDISNGAGSIFVTGLKGQARIYTGVGDIEIRDLAGSSDLSTGIGDIKSWWNDPASVPGTCRLAAEIGQITVCLPDTCDAVVEAHAGLGEVRRDGQDHGNTALFTLGTGQARFSLSSGLGDIELMGSRYYATQATRQGRRSGRAHHVYHNTINFGASGGPYLAWPDRSARGLNQGLGNYGFSSLKEKEYSWGGGGYAQFGRVRIGGMGWGRELKADVVAADTQRSVAYKYDLGGVTVEYVVLRSRSGDLSLGGMAGSGKATVKLVKSTRSDLTWDETSQLDKEREMTLQAKGFAGMPFVRLRVRLLGWMTLQAQAGYLYCQTDDWKTYTEKDVFNAPTLNAGGWVFNLGPFFGFN